MKKSKPLQKFTESEAKIDRILSLETIEHRDLTGLNEKECARLMAVINDRFQSLKDVERDKFLKKIEAVLSETTKNQLWEANHTLISRAISVLMFEKGRMPCTTEIASQTGLSRQTIHKHLKEYANNPLYLEQLEQFRFMSSKVLAKVFQLAINGDIGAAKLYFNVLGFFNKEQNPINTLIQNQNNFIQVNGTVLSQETLKHLNSEQLNTIEAILKTAIRVEE